MDLEAFQKVPCNDVLIYLHQNKYINSQVKITDIYERINKPTYIFCVIIDNLIRQKLIVCKNYTSLTSRAAVFPDIMNNVVVDITVAGEDYVESKLFGYNPAKYDKDDSTDSFKYFLTFSTRLSRVFKKPFSYFEEIARNNINNDANVLYFLCTGKTHKVDNEMKVFISYSWDSEPHKIWIDNLANDLRQFNVEYDRNLKYGMSPNNYMKRNILSSDFVIIVFTPKYLERINTRDSGVNKEFSIIEEELFRKISKGKYLAILKEGDASTSIPDIMKDTLYFNFTAKENYVSEVQNLIKTISES